MPTTHDDPMMRRQAPQAAGDSLFDLLARHAPKREESTSDQAGRVAARHAHERYHQILDALRSRPQTLFELASTLHCAPHQISGRLTELTRDGHIEPTGERRRNPATGCTAQVHRLVIL